MRRLNPIYFFKFLVSFVKELLNYRFYWKKITGLEKSGELTKRGLRVDAIKRLYFVKNMEPEALLYGEVENGGVEQFEKQFVADALRIHNQIFISDGSIELVKAETKRIQTKDYYAYLIWIGFRFVKINFWNVLYIIAYFVALILTSKYVMHMFPYWAEGIGAWLKTMHIIR